MSFNPFVLFQYKMFEGFEKKGQVYFVQQTFERARDHFSGAAGYYLLTHYEHLSHAQTHQSAVRNDPSSKLYHLYNEDDKQMLKELLAPSSNNSVYAALIADPRWDEKAKQLFKPAIQKWVQINTNWNMSRESVLPVKFDMIFGELFIYLKWGKEEKRIKLVEMEKMNA
ncbi:MAG TPA: hypothetical protein VK498_10260 [Ferruginibacter sp.]|nr:hypothetical protein [Ferruginibacter sp.]